LRLFATPAVITSSMTKYKDYVNKMLDENKKLFETFKKLHDDYALNQDPLQEKFNTEGEKILEVVRDYENRLCANTERGMYNKYSPNLAEKFQDEVRKVFPMIDHIGLIVETPKNQDKTFLLKKITLN